MIDMRVTHQDQPNHEFSIRQVTGADCYELWIWRNEEVTRRMSRNQSLIPWQEHYRWFQQSLENSNRIMLIGTIETNPVSSVRYDRINFEDSSLEISISVAREWRGRGIAQRSIATSLSCARARFPHSELVVANIRVVNFASINAFRQCGFREVSQYEDDFLRFEKSL